MNWIKRIFPSRQSPIVNRRSPMLDDGERKRRALQLQMTLAGFPDTHPLWQAILEIVDEHEHNMMTEAIAPKLSNEERQFNAGLAASAEYLANALRDLKAKANAETAKRKGTD